MEDWGGIALYLGYPDEQTMLRDMYLVKKLSTSEIARRVEMAQPTVVRRLKIAGIERRARGGRQTTQRFWYKLHLLDQRYVFVVSISKIAKVLHMSESLIYKYKRSVIRGFQPDTADSSEREVSKDV